MEISLDLTSVWNGVISSANGKTKCAITNTKLYVSVVTLSTEDNVTLLKQLESSFKRTGNRKKYQYKLKHLPQNSYLIHLTDPSFQGLNWFFVLSFENRMYKCTNEIF